MCVVALFPVRLFTKTTVHTLRRHRRKGSYLFTASRSPAKIEACLNCRISFVNSSERSHIYSQPPVRPANRGVCHPLRVRRRCIPRAFSYKNYSTHTAKAQAKQVIFIHRPPFARHKCTLPKLSPKIRYLFRKGANLFETPR